MIFSKFDAMTTLPRNRDQGFIQEPQIDLKNENSHTS